MQCFRAGSDDGMACSTTGFFEAGRGSDVEVRDTSTSAPGDVWKGRRGSRGTSGLRSKDFAIPPENPKSFRV